MVNNGEYKANDVESEYNDLSSSDVTISQPEHHQFQ